ncbi:MAG: hypothetical protein JXB39_12705 [Deltaproteobacteria bacterium]|nr:hypothetical protein [Deltaproteobacteria bacterium]
MLWLFVALLACRPDPGDPEYPEPGPWGDTGGDFLPGPDPYEDGDARLSLGFFYEGGYSDFDPPEHLYIYENSFTTDVSGDRVEGLTSDVWIHGGGAWWGGGIHYDAARDFSAWTTLYISLMAPAEGGFPTVDVAMEGGSQARLDAGTYGFAQDGEWHHLAIPLAAFASAGADLSGVTVPLILVDEGGNAGDRLFIDNLYLE